MARINNDVLPQKCVCGSLPVAGKIGRGRWMMSCPKLVSCAACPAVAAPTVKEAVIAWNEEVARHVVGKGH